MPHIVTQSCCSDASCVYACPVNCIHPTPDEPDFLSADMLYIDPVACVDCGACAAACPVDAIVPHTKLPAGHEGFAQVNADFYREPRPRPLLAIPPVTPKADDGRGTLRVAVVGSGPAALYAADELLKQRRVQVNVFEKLPVPHGLARFGVAPDHRSTRQVAGLFEVIAAQPNFEYFLGVEVGRDITHAELAEHHHAVIYAYGASADRRLDIPGESLPGSCAATEFVAWYNGHPDYADRRFDLDTERVVVVGNGNVALDVARILTSDPDTLAATDIAPHALEALRASKVREVVVLGRRGPAQAGYTLPELLGLVGTHGAQVVVDPAELVLDEGTAAKRAGGTLDPQLAHKLDLVFAAAARGSTPGTRRIVLRYLASPTEVLGHDRAEGVVVARNELVEEAGRVVAKPTGATEVIAAGLVLRSVGYRGRPLPGVPFDERRAVVPNEGGRVLGRDGGPLPGVYAAGWIKRGPSGFIGTNKSCSTETVENLVADFNAGRLPQPTRKATELARLLPGRGTAPRRPRRGRVPGWR